MRDKILWGALFLASAINVVLFVALLKGETGKAFQSDAGVSVAVSTGDASSDSMGPPAYGSAPIRQVALARLLANPHEFDGQRLDVEGYVGYESGTHGGLFIFTNPTDGEYSLVSNGVALDYGRLDPRQLEGACFVEGIYHSAPTWLPFGGSLQVERVISYKRTAVDGGVSDVRGQIFEARSDAAP